MGSSLGRLEVFALFASGAIRLKLSASADAGLEREDPDCVRA